jgi:hypothetical protein
MAEDKKLATPHPDDFVCVTLALDFQAKLNPEADDPPPVNFSGFESSLRASDAADFLESVVRAIRDRRLYAFMVQQAAESAVGAGEWIEKSPEEVFSEACGDANEAEQKSSRDSDEGGHDV